jgi:3-keto-disaccharide hydrolase
MRGLFSLAVLSVAACAAHAAEPQANNLTAQEIADGRILLFDGESTFGWKTEGEVTAKNGELVIGGKKASSVLTTTPFGQFDLDFQLLCDGGFKYMLREYEPTIVVRKQEQWTDARLAVRHRNGLQFIHMEFAPRPGPEQRLRDTPAMPIGFKVAEGTVLRLRNLKLRPFYLASLFNGKDLDGWKVFPGDRYKSKFTVTPEGWINVKNGPGDLQTEKTFADFVFQGDCISNGEHLNSGIFFRCLPNQYQNGYEMQIRNEWKDNDRTKPVDFGTGAIYRRQPARKVVSTDREWFTMTLVAHGNHFATWVNGYQVTDWTDTRPENENPRNGLRLGAGHLSIQGHDPTTDLSFRNLRVAELKK